MAGDNHGASSLFRRAEQLKRWRDSETNKQDFIDKPRKTAVTFSDGCIFLAAAAAGDKDELLRLLDRGADINTVNQDGITALHAACIDNNFSIVEFLVDAGADINRSDMEGWTPLHATASCGSLTIAKFLVDRGSDLSLVNNDGELAVDVVDEPAMEQLLQEEMMERGVDGDAARSREERCMLDDARQWMGQGKVQDVPHPKTGATALHVAAAKGYIKVIRLLLESGADVNATDYDGWTPLHAAVYWGQNEAVELLCDSMANMDAVNLVGQTPLDLDVDDSIKPLLDEMRRKQDKIRQTRKRKNSPAREPSKRKESQKRENENGAKENSTENGKVAASPDPLEIQSWRRPSSLRATKNNKEVRSGREALAERSLSSPAHNHVQEPTRNNQSDKSTDSSLRRTVSFDRDNSKDTSNIPVFQSPPRRPRIDRTNSCPVLCSAEILKSSIKQDDTKVVPSAIHANTYPDLTSYKLVNKTVRVTTSNSGAQQPVSITSSEVVITSTSNSVVTVTSVISKPSATDDDKCEETLYSTVIPIFDDGSQSPSSSLSSIQKSPPSSMSPRTFNRVSKLSYLKSKPYHASDTNIHHRPLMSSQSLSNVLNCRHSPRRTSDKTVSSEIRVPCDRTQSCLNLNSAVVESSNARRYSRASEKQSNRHSFTSADMTNGKAYASNAPYSIHQSTNSNDSVCRTTSFKERIWRNYRDSMARITPSTPDETTSTPPSTSTTTTTTSLPSNNILTSSTSTTSGVSVSTSLSSGVSPNRLVASNVTTITSGGSPVEEIIPPPPKSAPVIVPPVEVTKPASTPSTPVTEMPPPNGGASGGLTPASMAASVYSFSKMSPSSVIKNFFKSFVPPTRDDESETQRKANARLIRSSRRSTQGVSLDDLKTAENLYIKPSDEEKNKTNSQLAESRVPTTPDKADEEDRRPSWRLKVDDTDKNRFCLEDVRGGKDSNGAPTRNGQTKNKTDEKKEDDTLDPKSNSVGQSREGSQAAIQRRKKPKRRSTGRVHVDMDEIDPEKRKTKENNNTDESLDSNISERSTESGHSRASSQDLDGEIDYKKLYEEQLCENRKLVERLRGCEREVRGAKEAVEVATRQNGPQSLAIFNTNSSKLATAENDRREKRALERKLSEMEEELRLLEQLRQENKRLRDENGALIRVISKLSR